MSNTLRWLGIIYLLASIVVAVVIICNCGTVDGGTFYVDTDTNLMAIGCSVGIIFQGILVFCGAGGLAQVMDRCEEIAHKLGISDNTGETGKENNQENEEV